MGKYGLYKTLAGATLDADRFGVPVVVLRYERKRDMKVHFAVYRTEQAAEALEHGSDYYRVSRVYENAAAAEAAVRS